MVLGILGLTICGIVAPFAWGMGKKSLDNIRGHPGQYQGEGMAQAGYVMGIIGTILLIIAGVFLIIWVIIMASTFPAR